MSDGSDGRYGFSYTGGVLKFVDERGVPQEYATEYVMFHAPTEHAFVNDQLADLEMQIVHKSKTSEKKAIVSIIYTSFADKLHVKGLGTLSPTQKTIEGLDMSETVYLAG